MDSSTWLPVILISIGVLLFAHVTPKVVIGAASISPPQRSMRLISAHESGILMSVTRRVCGKPRSSDGKPCQRPPGCRIRHKPPKQTPRKPKVSAHDSYAQPSCDPSGELRSEAITRLVEFAQSYDYEPFRSLSDQLTEAERCLNDPLPDANPTRLLIEAGQTLALNCNYHTARGAGEVKESEQALEAALAFYEHLTEHATGASSRDRARLTEHATHGNFFLAARRLSQDALPELTRNAALAHTINDKLCDPRENHVSVGYYDSRELGREATMLQQVAQLISAHNNHGLAGQCAAMSSTLKQAAAERRAWEESDKTGRARRDVDRLPGGDRWEARKLEDYDQGIELTRAEFAELIADTQFKDTVFVEADDLGEHALTPRERGMLAGLLQDLGSAYPSVAQRLGILMFLKTEALKLSGMSSNSWGLAQAMPLTAHLAPDTRNYIAIYPQQARQQGEIQTIGDTSDERMFATIIHEFGHQVHTQAVQRTQRDPGTVWDVDTEHEATRDWESDMMQRNGITGHDLQGMLRDSSSEYATYNISEAVAEAFTDAWIHGSGAAEINRFLANWVTTDITLRDIS